MVKPYTKILKEDLYPYLTSYHRVKGTKHTKHTIKYIFDITNSTREARDYFYIMIRTYECWKYGATSNTVHYTTGSETLKNLIDSKEESVEDIPEDAFSIYVRDGNRQSGKSHMQDAMRFAAEYPCEFKQKEKEMSNDKLKVNYNIDVSVSGCQYRLTDPVNPDKALEVVLKLNNRLHFLNDQLKELNGITEGDEIIDDKINTNNITKIVENEIEEIKELIDYINDNLDTKD